MGRADRVPKLGPDELKLQLGCCELLLDGIELRGLAIVVSVVLSEALGQSGECALSTDCSLLGKRELDLGFQLFRFGFRQLFGVGLAVFGRIPALRPGFGRPLH